AVHDTGVFALDGSIVHQTPSDGTYDWQAGPGGAGLFTAAGARAVTPVFNLDGTLSGATGPLLASTWIDDPLANDPSYFNSNKDISPIGTGVPQEWGCGSQNTPTPKDNIQHAYAGLFQVPANGSPE